MNRFTEMLPSVEELVQKLKGRNSALRPSKPTKENGLVRYIWRMARFHSGADMTMPMSCHFDLKEWCEENNIAFSYVGYRDPEQRELLNAVDARVDEVLVAMNLDTTRAARRYRGLLYN